MKLRLGGGHLKLYIRGRKGYIYLERVLLAIVILSLLIVFVISLLFNRNEEKAVINTANAVNKTELKEEPIIIEEAKEPEITNTEKAYRLTSYYTGDGMGSTHLTGSGISTKSFGVNDKGWYTYKGKLVIAAATEELLNSKEFANDKAMHTRIEGRHYFRYFDEITITIDGIDYEAIVLDSCGASMKVTEDRIDLFVSSSYNKIDRGYKGVNPITVSMEVR